MKGRETDTTDLQDAWDRDYARKGRLWAREQEGLPSFLPGTRVLEAGCGDGKTLRALVKETPGTPGNALPEIVAFDFSRKAVRLSRASLSHPERICLVAADATCLPFISESFDAVLLFHVIGHATSGLREAIAREAERVTRNGGCLYIRVFSTADFRAGRGSEEEEGTYRRGSGILTHYFTPDEIVRLFSPLRIASLSTVRWTLKIRGNDLQREEIHAVLRKPERNQKAGPILPGRPDGHV